MDMTEISGMASLAKAVMDGTVDVATKDRASELYESILPLQQMRNALHAESLTLQMRNAELTNKIAELDKWNARAAKYRLKKIAAGVFVRSYVENMENTGPAYNVCTNYYEDGRISILQVQEPPL